MSERESQIAFIKKLALYENDTTLFDLQEKIAQAEKEERTVRYTAGLVALIGLISAWGLGYCAVFIDGFFQSPGHFMVKFFAALSLGSLLSLFAFCGFWLWQRSLVNRLYQEVRKLLLSLNETRFHSIRRQFIPVTVSYMDTAESAPASTTSLTQDDSDLAQAA